MIGACTWTLYVIQPISSGSVRIDGCHSYLKVSMIRNTSAAAAAAAAAAADDDDDDDDGDFDDGDVMAMMMKMNAMTIKTTMMVSIWWFQVLQFNFTCKIDHLIFYFL